jgi:hypothetical protein
MWASVEKVRTVSKRVFLRFVTNGSIQYPILFFEHKNCSTRIPTETFFSSVDRAQFSLYTPPDMPRLREKQDLSFTSSYRSTNRRSRYGGREEEE